VLRDVDGLASEVVSTANGVVATIEGNTVGRTPSSGTEAM